MANVDWIEGLLEEALMRNWCVKMACTTCGAHDFRKALKARLNPNATGKSLGDWRKLCAADGFSIVEQLRRLDPTSDQDRIQWDSATMLLLYLSWYAIGEPGARTRMPAALKGTYAGGILDRMIAHSDSVNAAREAYERSQTPEAVARRRSARKAERQRRHAERLERKKERDAIYWAAQRQKTAPASPDDEAGDG